MLVPLLVALLCHCGFSLQQRRTKYHRQPHVVLILADDLGFNDVPWHNPTMQVISMGGEIVLFLGIYETNPSFYDMAKGLEDGMFQAPTLANLAKEGVILEQNYVQPKCAPSRAALMTGDPGDPSNLILSSRTQILT